MINPFIIFICIWIIGATTAPAKELDNFFKDKTKIDQPFSLRDPFKAPVSKTDKGQKRGYTVSGKGQYTNIAEIPLDQVNIGEMKVIGVLIGRERRAMINPGSEDAGKKNKIIIVKEGMKIGPEGAELKAILPGGVILVEKMVNVYGEEEYLETVIPISK